MSKVSRRTFGRTSLLVLAGAPFAAACGGGELTCPPGSLSADQRSARSALQYEDVSSDPARHCSACALYTGNDTSCGTCSVVPGSIHPHGSCLSFAARPS